MSKERAEITFEQWALRMPRAELGGLIKEFVAESNHGSWSGYSSRDLSSIRNLFRDIMSYRDNYGEDAAAKLSSHINNVNPVA